MVDGVSGDGVVVDGDSGDGVVMDGDSGDGVSMEVSQEGPLKPSRQRQSPGSSQYPPMEAVTEEEIYTPLDLWHSNTNTYILVLPTLYYGWTRGEGG